LIIKTLVRRQLLKQTYSHEEEYRSKQVNGRLNCETVTSQTSEHLEMADISQVTWVKINQDHPTLGSPKDLLGYLKLTTPGLYDLLHQQQSHVHVHLV